MPARPDALPRPEPRPAAAVRRILLATDLSPASEGATREAMYLARDLHASLLIVSVIEAGTAPSGGSRVQRMDQRRAQRELAAQAVVVRGREAGIQARFLVWEGEPGPAIVEAAAAEQVDMIVVGSHGRGTVGRLLLGSVSDHVIRNATAPVLVVRP